VTLLDMRAGMDTTRAQVVQVFGEMRPHHTHIFAILIMPQYGYDEIVGQHSSCRSIVDSCDQSDCSG